MLLEPLPLPELQRLKKARRSVYRVNFISVDWYGQLKKSPQKLKWQFLEINLFVFEKEFHENLHVFPIDNPYSCKYGEKIFNFNSFLDKTTTWFQKRIQKPFKRLKCSILHVWQSWRYICGSLNYLQTHCN